ncbi:MAG: leucine-rich repeat domain-containing protein [Clostridiales Family XIII bacterium]|jgi:hypothetical protein|nr:leucine-rich repeat domain-containing protein [Clostridiales Family XIII bacterium]
MIKRSEKNLGAKFLSVLLVVAMAVALLWPLSIGKSFAADEDSAEDKAPATEAAESVDVSVPEADEVLPLPEENGDETAPDVEAVAKASSLQDVKEQLKPIPTLVSADKDIAKGVELLALGEGAYSDISALAQYDEFTVDGIHYEVLAGNASVTITAPLSGYYGDSVGTPITIPDIVQDPGTSAFYTVTEIDASAFKGVNGGTPNSFSSIELPDTITKIGGNAFQYQPIESIVLSSALTTLGSSAFAGCESLKSITLPEGLTAIPSYVFDGCEGLESVNIPSSVASIANGAFRGNSGLKALYFENPTASLTCSGTPFSGSFDAEMIYVPIGTSAAYGTITGLTGFTEYGVELSVRKDNASWEDSSKTPTIEIDDSYAVNYVPAGTDKIRYIYTALIDDEADGEYDIFDGSTKIGTVEVENGLAVGSPVYANYYTVHYDNGSDTTWTGTPIADEIYPKNATAVVKGISGLSTDEDKEVVGWNLGDALKLQGNSIAVTAPIEFVPALASKKQITYSIHSDDASLVSYTSLPQDANWYSAGTNATVLGNTDLKLYGMRFIGWKVDPTSDKVYKPGSSIKASDNIELFAYFEEWSYTGKGGKDLDFGTFTGKETITVTIDGDINDFEGLFIDDIDGEVLDSKFYTKKSGSTIITLKSSYLKTLADDDYLFVAKFSDGLGDIPLTVETASAGNKPGGGQKPGGGSAGGPDLGAGGGPDGSDGSGGSAGGAGGATKTGDSMDLMMMSVYTALSLMIILAIAFVEIDRRKKGAERL